MLLRYDDEPASSTGHRVRQAARHVVVVEAAVLVLDDELGSVVALSQDVDPASAGGVDFRLTDACEIHADRASEGVYLFGQKGREIGRLSLPSLRQSTERQPRHPRHGPGR